MHIRASGRGTGLSRVIRGLPGAITVLLAIVAGPMLTGVGVSTAAAEITEYEYPQDPFGGGPGEQIAVGPEGDLWFAGVGGPSPAGAGSGNGGIGRLSAPSEWEDVGSEPRGTFNNVFEGNGTVGIAVGPDNNLWFTAGRGVGRIKPSGTPLEAEDFYLPTVEKANNNKEPLPGTSLGGIVAGPEHENLWFTETENTTNKIVRVNAASHVMTEFPLPASNELGTGIGGLEDDDIAVGHEGNLWFTEPASQAIGVMNIKGEFLHKFPVATFPLSIAAGPDGDMWFTDGTTPDVIGRITPAGEVTEFSAPGPSADIVEGPDGNMWFTVGSSEDGPGLGCITPTGLTAMHPDLPPQIVPWGITADKDGSLWFSELNDYIGRLGELNPVVCGATPVVVTPVMVPVVTPVVAPLAPILSGLSETARTWREGGALASISKKSKKPKLPLGTTFSFNLNEAASVTFAFTESLSGRKVKQKCVTQTGRNRHRPRCTRTLHAGTLTFSAHAGTNKVRFEGPISTETKLRLGSYTLLATATTSGEQSAPRTLHFTIAH
jgi:virginiamycin B lyase